MIHLKTKLQPGQSWDDMQFAVLVEPRTEPGELTSDEDLYQAIHKHGKAVLAVNETDNPFKYKEELETLDPVEFERVWRVD